MIPAFSNLRTTNTQMQPAIKMALRVVRQGSDYLKAHFERQEPNGKDESERHRQLERVEQSIYDNFTEQLEKAYKDHVIAPLGESDAGNNEKSWHIFPVLGRDNFVRGIPEFVLALAEENWVRGYHQALNDVDAGQKIIEELDKADAHPYGSRPFKRENYINKFNILTNKILSKKESNRFLKVVQNLKKIKPGQLNKLNLEVKTNQIKKNKKIGIF